MTQNLDYWRFRFGKEFFGVACAPRCRTCGQRTARKAEFSIQKVRFRRQGADLSELDRQRDRETERQRDRETERLRQRQRKSAREDLAKRRAVHVESAHEFARERAQREWHALC